MRIHIETAGGGGLVLIIIVLIVAGGGGAGISTALTVAVIAAAVVVVAGAAGLAALLVHRMRQEAKATQIRQVSAGPSPRQLGAASPRAIEAARDARLAADDLAALAEILRRDQRPE